MSRIRARDCFSCEAGIMQTPTVARCRTFHAWSYVSWSTRAQMRDRVRLCFGLMAIGSGVRRSTTRIQHSNVMHCTGGSAGNAPPRLAFGDSVARIRIAGRASVTSQVCTALFATTACAPHSSRSAHHQRMPVPDLYHSLSSAQRCPVCLPVGCSS